VPQPAAGQRAAGRYEFQELISTRGQARRYRGLDHTGDGHSHSVVLLQMPFTASTTAEAPPPDARAFFAEDAIPTGEEPTTRAFSYLGGLSLAWPSIGWECQLLQAIDHPSVPRVLDFICENGHACVIEQCPEGRLLWDAWEDPATTPMQRFEWLAQIAEALQARGRGSTGRIAARHRGDHGEWPGDAQRFE
jgi:serine/threonine protein kinase